MPLLTELHKKCMDKELEIMILSDIILGFVLISQICVGFIGNSLLFGFYVYLYFIQSHLRKPIDLIFMHLTLVNVVAITFMLTPDIMSSFGVRNALNDVGCKAVLYINRVTRGVSLCVTSFLSTVQALTISPRNSKWAWIKSKLSMCIFPSLLFFWILNMLIYIHVIQVVTARSNFTLVGHGYSQVYCQTKQFGLKCSGSYLSIIVTRDLLFVVLMICTSLYMVSVLHRHHRTARHLHSPSLSKQPSPESKATCSILVLVSCFVLLFCLSNFITLYTFYTPRKNPKLDAITVILSSCYPIIAISQRALNGHSDTPHFVLEQKSPHNDLYEGKKNHVAIENLKWGRLN
uniref:Vomeronasal type-1 receptor n=1 Tax=Prolemur simus TaxID=1328070 RepID=A0A8C9B0M9_PROSS